MVTRVIIYEFSALTSKLNLETILPGLKLFGSSQYFSTRLMAEKGSMTFVSAGILKVDPSSLVTSTSLVVLLIILGMIEYIRKDSFNTQVKYLSSPSCCGVIDDSPLRTSRISSLHFFCTSGYLASRYDLRQLEIKYMRY